MQSSFSFYIFILVAVVIGVIVIKKVTSCLFRTVSLLAVIGVLVYLYLHFFKGIV